MLGCNYASADVDADQMLYVGGGKFHPLGLAMEHPDKNVVIADPVNNVVTIADTRKFMKQRYASVHKAMDAEKWGVIFCTKIGQGRMEIAEKILEDNENAYLITMDEVTPDRLRNFDMDAFVNTGCPRITTDDGPRFRSRAHARRVRRRTATTPVDAAEWDTSTAPGDPWAGGSKTNSLQSLPSAQ